MTAAILIQAVDGAAASCILGCGASFSGLNIGAGGASFSGIMMIAVYCLVRLFGQIHPAP